jgi:hypothetical protein
VAAEADSLGRAVSSLASARLNRVKGAGHNRPCIPSRFLLPVGLRFRLTQLLLFAAVCRHSHLCVLMNPILPGLEIHPDLAGVNPFNNPPCESGDCGAHKL